MKIMDGTDNTLLVCMSAAPSSKRVIRAGAEIAKSMGVPWIAVYVRTDTHDRLSNTDKRSLHNNLNLAEHLGGEIHTLRGKNAADEIIRFARHRNIRKIIIGKNPKNRLGHILPFRRDIIERIFRTYPFFDIHVIPGTPKDYTWSRNFKLSPRRAPLAKLSWRSLIITLGIFAAATAVGFSFYRIGFSDENIIMVFLLAVLFVSISAGRLFGLASSLLSVMLFNFLFTEPRFTFVVNETHYLVTFPVMLIVALTASELTVRMKRESINAAIREKRTEFLYMVSRRLLETIGKEEVIMTVTAFIEQFLNRKTVCFLADTSGNIRPLLDPENHSSIDGDELEAAGRAFTDKMPAGYGTDIMSDAEGFYVPLSSRDIDFGVLGIYYDEKKGELDSNQRSLFEAVAAQLSVGLDRERLYAEQERSRIEIEREKMQSNLLRSISHDLRTPLSAIAGASSILLSENEKISGKDRSKLLTDIVNDATWLTQLVENLLSLTRAEEGKLGVSQEWEIVEEVVLGVVERMKKHAPHHHIRTILPDEPFMAPMDTSLIQQVLINLLDNAIRYTPGGTEINIRIRKDTNTVSFEVADTGPGIPGEIIPTIFNRFVTVDRNAGRDRRGLGLGLAICKSIVEAHEGSISVENSDSGGTVFSFSLPVPVDSDVLLSNSGEGTREL